MDVNIVVFLFGLIFQPTRVLSSAVCGSAFTLGTDLAVSDAGDNRAMEYVESGATKLLVTGGKDRVMRVWDLVTGSTTPRLYHRHMETIWALEWIPELDVLASGCGDGLIRLWPVSVLQSEPSCSNDNCCDGSGLGCGGEHILHWHWTGLQKREQIHSLEWVSGVGGNGTLVSGWSDGGLRTWLFDGVNWAFGDNLQSDGFDTADRTYDMVWLSASGVLGTASPDWPYPRLWSSLTTVDNFDYLSKAVDEDGCPSNSEHCEAVLAIDTNAAGDTVVTGGKDQKIILWDADAKTRIATLTSHTDYVTSLAWLHSEDKIASGSADSSILIWDATTNTDTSSTIELLDGHAGNVQALLWIPGLKGLASADSDGNVKLWDCT